MNAEFGYHELERSALAFVLEPETFPVFLEWAQRQHVSSGAHDWLESVPSLRDLQAQWLAHSPNPAIRALADWMPQS